jgi:hypothetical protein
MGTPHHRLTPEHNLEAIGRLAGGVAQDFNNLLTSILGYTRLVRDQLPGDHPAQGDLAEVLASAERAQRLTYQLLAFGRRQMMEVRVLDLRDLVSGLTGLLRRSLGDRVELRVESSEEACPIKADARLLERVVQDLAANAVDAMPEGGKLTVGVDRVALAPSEAEPLEGLDPGPHVCLTMQDEGVGFSEEARRHVFEPFFSTKTDEARPGLGLSTAYGIVRQCGGCIALESAPGAGATFRLYFPLSGETAPKPPAPRQTEFPHGTETILVVEDEGSVRRLTTRMLKQLGYEGLEAASPREALDLLGARSDSVDLLLTDVAMPGMSGRELVAKLREAHPSMKAVYMSGYTDTSGELSDEVSLLTKPFTREQLAHAVRDALRS